MRVLAAKRVRSIEESRDEQSARLSATQMSDSVEVQKEAKDDSDNATWRTLVFEAKKLTWW
jgi:hypothetical protein